MIFALLYVSRLSEKFFISAFALFAIAVSVIGADIYLYGRHLEKVREAKSEEASNLYTQEYTSLLPIHNYQRDRILTFVAPDVIDPAGTGPNRTDAFEALRTPSTQCKVLIDLTR